jgi:hypothetical protein
MFPLVFSFVYLTPQSIIHQIANPSEHSSVTMQASTRVPHFLGRKLVAAENSGVA